MRSPLSQVSSQRVRTALLIGLAALLLCAGLIWLVVAAQNAGASAALPPPTIVAELTPGVTAAMTSPLFTYSPGWQISAAGADPSEPAAPFAAPAGVVEFVYRGRDLALALAPGDYWAYLFVTVDGAPANRLPAIPGNTDSRGAVAGYKPLLQPEQHAAVQPLLQWLALHRADDDGPHHVRIEVWRGWGQTPLRGVAVDALHPAPWPRWPGVAALVAGVAVALLALWRQRMHWLARRFRHDPSDTAASTQRPSPPLTRAAAPLALAGGALGVLGVFTSLWWMTAAGVTLLAIAGVARPALWLTALLAALPFAYGIKLPLLPGRSVSIIDLGVFGGILIVAASWLLGRSFSPTIAHQDSDRPSPSAPRPSPPTLLFLGALTGWALISASAARYPEFALREWRTVFLAALLFGLLLVASQRIAAQPAQDRRLLVAGWLFGATAIAAVGLAGYLVGGRLLSAAEGVARVQSLYDSPNNLALYLDRTLPVTVALALLLRQPRLRLLCLLLAGVQGLALLLTFSKGSLFVAMPAAGVVLAIGGGWLLRRQGRSLRVLLWLLAGGLGALLVLAPFVGAERFQRLFDLTTGTGYLRLLLWRSAWQMAQDFPLLGVGPDNFLYHYRSDYLLPAAWREPALNHPHNLFLDWWTRLGIPGLILGGAWLASGVVALTQALRQQQQGALRVGLLAGAAAALAHGLIDVSYALPDLMLVWVFMFSLATPVDGQSRAS